MSSGFLSVRLFSFKMSSKFLGDGIVVPRPVMSRLLIMPTIGDLVDLNGVSTPALLSDFSIAVLHSTRMHTQRIDHRRVYLQPEFTEGLWVV